MDIIGIIAEYNPFHNGHIYHINKIKEKYPDAILILVLNGYFLARAILNFVLPTPVGPIINIFITQTPLTLYHLLKDI